MKNPLIRRLPRELAKDAAKYVAIFVMMVLLISVCSGMRVGNESLKAAYYDSFELYDVEDGHITFDKALPEELKAAIEEQAALTLYGNMYIDEDAAENTSTVRVYRQSDVLNKPCLLSGELPAADGEIAVDRLYADHNGIDIGSVLTLNGKPLIVTGFIALPDYSTLFENNTDPMFDSVNFSVAVMTDGGFDSIESKNLRYNYAWRYNTAYADDFEAAERSEKLLDIIKDELTDYDEKIVKAQVDELTDRLEKAAEEYGELYKAALEEKVSEVTENVTKGAEEYAALYMTTGQKPEKSALSTDVDDFTFGLIESSVAAALEGKEPVMPTEQQFKDEYLSSIPKPRREELKTQLDDFLFGIVEDAVAAEIYGTEYVMPEDEAFEGEIDKTDIISVDNYVPRYLNQGITFAIDDIGGDEAGCMVMCYLMIALIAFIFAVTISNTIVTEAGVIGTLRASGYTRGELMRHYMILPLLVTLAAGVVGNIIGYTVLKDFCVEIYLASYSMTNISIVWDASAFLLSTVVPIVLMLIINTAVLASKLRLSPLKFLRHDLKRNRNKKAMRLNTKIPFRTRFSLRIFFTNLPGYIVMIVGILFGAVLISFGDMMPRMLNEYKDIVMRDMICDYQYILYDCDEAHEVTDPQAEKFALASFDYTKEGYLTDSLSVYGVEDGSRYVSADIPEGKALISTGISEKFGLKAGDALTLDEPYKRDVSYTVEIGGVYDYRSSMAIFMRLSDFNKTFDKNEAYFTGYFSNAELTELPADDVATVMTADDYTKLSDQLTISMGSMMNIFKWFGAMFFIIVVYVLCKQVIERNFQSIAMTKILGFRNGEIAGLYIASTTIAVLVGLALAVPFIDFAMRAIFKTYLYTVMTGYIPYIMNPMTYIVMIVTGIACYAVVAALQLRKVAKVSRSEALKNVE